MTYQKDFILRMIEMMAELIAGLLGLIKKGELKQAEKAIDNAYHNFLKEDAALFRSIPKEKLTDQLLHKHNYTKGHLEVLAELFFAEAELKFAEKKVKESLEYYEKSLILHEYVIRETKAFSFEKQKRIDHIKNRIEGLNQ